jgi:hypothetical protein
MTTEQFNDHDGGHLQDEADVMLCVPATSVLKLQIEDEIKLTEAEFV